MMSHPLLSKLRSLVIAAVAVTVSAGALSPLVSRAASASAPAATAKKRVLFFSKSSGFVHEAIADRLADGRPGYSFAVMRKIAEANNIEMVFSKDGSQFASPNLESYDGFIFYTTGDLTVSKNSPDSAPAYALGDGNPPMPADGKERLIAAIKSGKGLIGIHSAADTFHTDGQNQRGPKRFVSDGARADAYAKLLGGEFIQHGDQQISKLRVMDRTFPGMAGYPGEPAIMEEWYSLKNFAADLHVLLVNQTKEMKGFEYERPDYPSTWIRKEGKGRVFYTNMGHREDVWNSPEFQGLITGALQWTLGRVEADTTPNLKAAAPNADTMPKYQAPTPLPTKK